jgi:hypothetical protein
MVAVSARPGTQCFLWTAGACVRHGEKAAYVYNLHLLGATPMDDLFFFFCEESYSTSAKTLTETPRKQRNYNEVLLSTGFVFVEHDATPAKPAAPPP